MAGNSISISILERRNLPPGSFVYAVNYNSCIHESSDGIESLHRTLAGAYRAYRSLLLKDCEQRRRDWLQLGRLIWERGEKHGQHERFTITIHLINE